jgi:hypothetical protein
MITNLPSRREVEKRGRREEEREREGLFGSEAMSMMTRW